MSTKLALFRSADYGDLSELQKRDDNNGSHADLPRRRLRGCHLQMQRVSFGHKARVQTAFGRVGTCHTPKFRTSPMKQKKENSNRSHWASLTLIHERRWCSEGNPVERVPEDRE